MNMIENKHLKSKEKNKECGEPMDSAGMSALWAGRSGFIYGNLTSRFSYSSYDILACKDIPETHR